MEEKSIFLSESKKHELISYHRNLKNKRIADRIKCLLMLNNGLTPEEISIHLLISIKSINRYKETYNKKGIKGVLNLEYKTYTGKLTAKQEEEIKKDIRNNMFTTSKAIAKHIETCYGIKYTEGGLVITLHRLGFVYKKLKQVPAKADEEKQKAFVSLYNELKKNLKSAEKIYFTDGVHPQHNSKPCYAWIEKGTEKKIKSNTGRQRININGVYSPHDQEIIFREDKSINAQSTIDLLTMIEEKHPELSTIYIIRDNAKYYSNKEVKKYLETSKIVMIPLPTYSPNLNLIERLWRLMKKKVMNGQYYEKYEDFRLAVRKLLTKDVYEIADELKNLMTERFQIINSV